MTNLKTIAKSVCLAAAASLCSCSLDLGNYDYKELNNITISGVDDNINVLVYDRLTLNPVLEHDVATENYTFEWKAISNDENQEVTIIGEDLALDYKMALLPGEYSLYLTVTEKASGLFWRQSYTLTVSEVTSEGWMVLCSDNGRARLDMISSVTSKTYFDILKDNGMPELNGPRKIQWLKEKTSPDSPFYLLADDGATRLGRNSFSWKPEYDFSYEVAVVKKLKPYSIVTAGFGKMIVSDTEAYYCEVMGIDGLYGSAVNKDFKVAPYIGANTQAAAYASVYLLYDIDHGKFMAYCPLMEYPDLGGQNPLVTMEEMEKIAISLKGTDAVISEGFDEYPEGMECLYMENTGYDPGNGKMGRTYAVLDDGGKIYVYGIQMGDLMMFSDCTFVLGKSYKGELTGCQGIAEENCLYAFSSLKNYMYYASGDKVYRVDLNDDVLQAKLQITVPGEKITCLKFANCQTEAYSSRKYDLIVGSEKDGAGTLRIYEGLKSEGDFTNVTPEKFDGFKTIKDVTFRERN